MKKLPIKVDIPEFLVKMVYDGAVSERQKATTKLTLITSYYLLWVGEYKQKCSCNKSKQTVQFRVKDVIFFMRYK